VISPPPPSNLDWVAITGDGIDADCFSRWVADPTSGATVTFAGTVRNHSEGRAGVTALKYEVYEEEALDRLKTIAAGARARWPEIIRLVLVHRIGTLAVGETSVVVALSSPHRGDAFEAARWCIDTVKTSVPIWKLETWPEGSAWSACSHAVAPVPATEGEVR